MSLISQSEVDSYLSCKRKHFYAFGEPCPDGSHGIQPVTHGVGLTRGTIGHKALAKYYEEIRLNTDFEKAIQLALSEITRNAVTNPDTIEIVSNLQPLLAQYFDFYAESDLEDIEILTVEHEFRYEIPGTDLIFPFKPDAIVRDKSRGGKIYVWDHKFIFNTYSDKSIGIMPQLAKYVYALRQMGYEVEDGLYNMISTRRNAKVPLKRQFARISKTKAETFFQEQIISMKAISEVKQLDNETWNLTSMRTASAYNCEHCPFLDICTSDLEQRNGRNLLLENFYEPNSYGYGKGEK